MAKRRFLAIPMKEAVIVAVALSLVLTGIAPLSRQVQAVDLMQPTYDDGAMMGSVSNPFPCQVQGEYMELAYDDGTMLKLISYPCPHCDDAQAVRFSLPGQMLSAVVTEVSFYYDPRGKTRTLRIDIMQGGQYVVSNISYQATSVGWQTVDISDATVSGDFYVVVGVGSGSIGYDRLNDYNRSWMGENERGLTYPVPGDAMIRARIRAELQVGLGQSYKTIQSAIDAAAPGFTVMVHEGTYSENVTVDRSVTIKSLSGPTKTIVQTSPPYSDNNVFRIAANCVTLSGFTIRSALYDGRAGVYIDDASGCVVSQNVIQDNSYGIYVSDGSTNNILLENECKYNATGIFIDGSDNYISGNRLHGNTAVIGPAVFLSSIASGNQLRFNSVVIDPETNPTVAASPQIYSENDAWDVSAVENWWGTDTGPANAGGEGPAVGDRVLYDPWLEKQPLRVMTVAASEGPFTLNTRSETSVVILKQGPGTPIFSVASFTENPKGEFRRKSLEKWFDLLFASTEGIDQVEIRVYYTADEVAARKLKEGSLRLFWWNGENWKVCSKTKVDKQSDYVWAELNLKTKPTPSDLTGTMFAVGIPKGGFSWWLIPLIIVIVIILLAVFRLFWVLVVKRQEGYTSID